MNFFTAYSAGAKDVNFEPGRLIASKRKIAKAYMRGWLPIDIVSTVPWGVLASVLLGGGTGSAGQLGKLARIVKFVRFMRLLRMLRLAKLAAIWEKIDAKCGSSMLMQGLLLVRVVFVLICICHWNACIWWMVGQRTSIITELMSDEAQEEWLAIHHWTTLPRSNGPNQPIWTWEERSTTEAYLFCFYWTLGVMRTMPAEVHPITLPERVYVMVFMFFAFSAFAICVAQITTTYFKFFERKRMYTDDMAAVRMHLRKLKVSDQLQGKIKVFFKHLYDTRAIHSREASTLNHLPEEHRKELRHIKVGTYLRRLPIFEGVSFKALNLVTEITDIVERLPGDKLCRQGTPATYAWILKVGRLRARYEKFDSESSPSKDVQSHEFKPDKINDADTETLYDEEVHLSLQTVVCITACTLFRIEKSKFIAKTSGVASFWDGSDRYDITGAQAGSERRRRASRSSSKSHRDECARQHEGLSAGVVAAIC
jgi:hypothetical protein